MFLQRDYRYRFVYKIIFWDIYIYKYIRRANHFCFSLCTVNCGYVQVIFLYIFFSVHIIVLLWFCFHWNNFFCCRLLYCFPLCAEVDFFWLPIAFFLVLEITPHCKITKHCKINVLWIHILDIKTIFIRYSQ